MSIASRINEMTEHLRNDWDSIDKLGLKAKKLPDEYKQVEYIESSGTQYIDTGFIPNQNTRTVIDFMPTSTGSPFIFGARLGYNDNAYDLYTFAGKFRDDYANTNYGNNSSESFPRSVNKRYLFDKNKNHSIMYEENVQFYDHTFTEETINLSFNMFLFGANNNGSILSPNIAKMRLYSCKIYDDNTIIRDFVPCYRNSDNVVGLYDTINDVFYTNQGTGVFTYGEVQEEIPNKNIENIAPVLDTFYNQSSDKTDLARNGVVGRTSQGGDPTPENPVEINNLSGDVEYKVRGKNLFDGVFRQGNHVSTTTANRICSNNAIQSKSGNYYTLSTNLPNTYKWKIMNCTANGTSTTVVNDTNYTSSGSVSVNCTINGYLKVLIGKTDDSNLTPSDVSSYWFQIEKGTTTTPYKPYISESFPLSLKSRNLFDSNGKIIENFMNNSGMTYTLDNGIYTLNGTNTQRYIYLRYNVELEPGSYIFTGCPKGGSFTGYSCIVRVGTEPLFDYGDGISFTLTEKATVMVYPVRVGADSITVNNLQFKPMLEKVDNLFDKDNANVLDGAFINATAKQIGSNANAKCLFIEVEPNTPYVISKSKGNRFAISTSSDLPKIGISLSHILDDRTKTTFEITSASDAKYLTIYFTISPDEDSLEDILSSIQVYKNVGPSDYEPYYDINLCNSSDYKDRIYSQNGEFYLEKKTGKVVLDGTTTITRVNTGTSNVYRFSITGPNDMKRNVNTEAIPAGLVVADKFKEISNVESYQRPSNGILVRMNNTNNFIINCIETQTYTVEQFKSWLSTHNTEAQYVLATPTTEKITQENYPTLYSQLLAIQEFLTKYKINKEFLLDYSSPEIEY